MEPDIWYLSRELVPFMPQQIGMSHKCDYVIKRAFDYGSIERKELETKGQLETFTMGRNVRLQRAFIATALGTALREMLESRD
jgi:hypothetical protein